MNWFDRNRHWVLLALAAALAFVFAGFLAASGLALLAGLLGGASVGALLADAALVVGVATLMILAEAALVVGLVVSVVRRLSFPTSDRLAALFARLELFVPPLRDVALSERFRPSVAERTRELKRRYVDGELSERAFEREMHDLLDEAEPTVAAADRPGAGDVTVARREAPPDSRPPNGRAARVRSEAERE